MKAAEGFFDAATCLSGPLSCYRKDLVLKYCDSWLHQTFLGQRATFGDDRSMVFKYEDGGRHYTVWYADSETLNAWITVAAERGIDNISLWRLGSNTDIEKVR